MTWKVSKGRKTPKQQRIRLNTMANIGLHRQIIYMWYTEKVNRKVLGVPHSQATANPWYPEEEKKKLMRVKEKQTNVREAHRPALFLKRGDHNAKQNKKSMAGPRSKNHKATQNKNNTKTTALERPEA